MIIAIACIPVPGAHAQLYRPALRFNNENGLNSNSIASMQTDRNGFTWLATNDGFARFDGSGIRNFSAGALQPKSSETLSFAGRLGNELVLLEYYFGYLFVINQDGSIAEKKGTRGTVNYQVNPVTNLLFRYKHWQMMKVSAEAANPGSLVLLDTAGVEGYFAGKDRYIHYFRDRKVTPTAVHAPTMQSLFLYQRRLYALSGSTGLTAIENGIPSVVTAGSFPALLQSVPAAERSRGRMIQKDTCIFYHMGSRLYQVLVHNPGRVDAVLLTAEADMPEITAVNLLPERNMLLIGTFGKGLFVFRKKYFHPVVFNNHTVQADGTRSSAGNHVFTVQPVSDSLVLTQQGLIDISGNGRRVSPNPVFNAAVPRSGSGYYLHYGKKGSVKLQVLDSAFRTIDSIDAGVPARIVNAFSNEGDTMYLNIPGGGIIRLYLPADRKFKKTGNWSLFNNAYVLSICKMPGDSLWVGTRDSGLYILNLRTLQYRRPEELKNKPITSIYQDKDHTIWLAVYEHGYYRYRQTDGLVKMPLDRKKILGITFAFAEDRLGYLWLTSREGLFRFLKSDLDRVTGPEHDIYYNYFSRDDGMPSEEFNGGGDPPIGMLKNGGLVFPAVNGMAVVDPFRVPAVNPDSIILITDILLNGKHAPANSSLVLPPDFKSFSLDVAVPYYGHSYNLQVEYRLSGGESGWTRLNENSQISFSRLPHGHYTLTIRVPRGFGSSGYYSRSISFRVLPFWYQTWWFIALVFLALLALVAWYYRERNRLMKIQQARLAEEIKQRTANLQVSEEKVRSTALFKSQVTSLVLHDVRSPLSYLTEITGGIYRSAGEQVPGDFREQLRDLYLSVKEVSEYAQNLFAWVQSQQEDFVMQVTRVRLFDLFEELCGNYHLLAAQNQNTIGHDVNPQLGMDTQADLIQIVLRNLVDNAIKYTQNGRITLHAALTGDLVRISVSDTGRGMDAEKVKRILSDEGSADATSKSGMGYRYIKDLLKKMGGKLVMESKEGAGTTVSILLPLQLPAAPDKKIGNIDE